MEPQNYNTTELEPEVINENTQPLEPALETPEEGGEEKPSIIDSEKLKPIAEELVTMLVKLIEPEFQAILDEKDNEIQATMSQKEESDKVSKSLTDYNESQKSDLEEHKGRVKDMESSHKEEISVLKKQLKDKDKEIKKLIKQVEQALENDND